MKYIKYRNKNIYKDNHYKFIRELENKKGLGYDLFNYDEFFYIFLFLIFTKSVSASCRTFKKYFISHHFLFNIQYLNQLYDCKQPQKDHRNIQLIYFWTQYKKSNIPKVGSARSLSHYLEDYNFAQRHFTFYTSDSNIQDYFLLKPRKKL